MTVPSVVGSVIEIKSSAGSGSQSVTVPSGATLLLVLTAWWQTGVPDYTTLSLNGTSFTTNKVVENASDSYECTNIYYLNNPATGTFSWAISTSEGAHIFLVFLKDTNASPITGSNYGQSNGDPVTGSFSTSTNDFIVGVGCAYGATGGDAGVSGQTELFDGGNYNSAYGVVGTKAGSAGTTTFTVDFTGSGMSNSVCAVSIAGTTGGQTGAVNQLSETDTLQAFSRTKQKEIGQQSETNTLQAFSRQKTITLGLLSETATVQAFARAKQKDLGQLESTETLFNFSIPIVYTLGLLTETSELQNFSRSKTAELQILTEPQLLFEFARLKEKEIGLLSTNETVQPFTTNKSISLGLLEEINTLFSISLPGEIVYELGILEETSTILSIARIKQIEIGLLSESGQLFTLDKQKITEIGLLSEASLLFALSGGLVSQAHYVYIIAAESRVFVVPAVEPDSERIYTIPAESRVYEVEHD